MSFYSYLEVVELEEKNRKENDDKDLYIRFRHGISWEYQIAVSGGSYLYQPTGVSNSPFLEQLAESYAKLIFEHPIDYCLRNYHEAIKACEAALKLNIPALTESIKEDLDCLREANEWFITAYNKLPNGLVRIDWCEYIWGRSEETLYAMSKLPDQHINFFREMAVDTKQFNNQQLTEQALVEKYKRNSDFTI